MSSGQDAAGSRHAAVVGMHRSGTSATANCLAELGLRTPDPDDLIRASNHNERGHWESKTLTKFDESILRQLGGTWSAPPCLLAGWEDADDRAMRDLRSKATELATAKLAHPPQVIKDPRLCLTLPLWRRVMPSEPVAVLVFREPLEVALSLQRRDGFPLSLGLALWYRYVRQSLVSLADLPVLVVEYARALDEPRQWVDDLVTFLGDNGITPGSDRSEDASQVLKGDLRHHHESTVSASLESDLQALLDVLRSRLGAHEKWSIPELMPEPVWVSDVISLTWAGQAVTTAMESAQEELKWLKKSRLFRVTNAVWRMTGKGPVLSRAENSYDAAGPGSNGAAATAPASR
jgi:hypothetical protein